MSLSVHVNSNVRHFPPTSPPNHKLKIIAFAYLLPDIGAVEN